LPINILGLDKDQPKIEAVFIKKIQPTFTALKYGKKG
jgi:hypothetical protein